jgi:hypothetical protein
VSRDELVTLTWDRVRAWRPSQQRLDRRVPKSRLLDVARNISGIHAQVQSSAELQVWARVSGISPGDIRDALWKERSLVKTWCMRGTLHLLAAEDLPTYVAALRTHDRWWKGAWLRMVGMTEKELHATLVAIRASLTARPVTREELEVTVHPFRKFAAAQKKQIREEADRLGRFLEAHATVAYGS